MALDFPNSPSLNDTYTESGRTWQWNGTAWEAVTAGITPGSISQDKLAPGVGGGLSTPAEGAILIMDIGV